MDLGRELVACALRTGSVRPFTEAGLNRDWLTDQDDPTTSVVFSSGEDARAWLSLLDHSERHGKVPTTDLFRRSFPETAYPLPDTSYAPDELVEIFQRDRRRVLATVAITDLADMIGDERVDDAIELMERAAKLIRSTHGSQRIAVDWDDDAYDVEGRIHRVIAHGIRTGIPGLDDQEGWYGFQPAHLVCYLGRAKAGKTSFALLSAISAWEDGKRVLFVSFEIAAGRTPEEPGISDRLDCFSAGIPLTKYMQGELLGHEQDAVRQVHANLKGQDSIFRIIQPTGRYTPQDLDDEIEKFQPDVVYVDGFYFMTDPDTGKTGANWEGHDNLASALKRIAMNRMLPVVITHQVREKQLTGKKGSGIDDGAMMGGTGIIMFADLVLGFDTGEDHLRTISCTRSRLQYLNTIHGKWDWNTCVFTEQEPEFDQDKFAGGLDEEAPF